MIAIYFFQYWINQPQRNGTLKFIGIDFTSPIASVLNAVIIVLLNHGYQGVAVKLNDFENHRTDTQYEDFLIVKLFMFQMVNSFAGLSYVAFIKVFLNIKCTGVTCTSDVASSLSTIFISSLVTRAITSIFVSKVSFYRHYVMCESTFILSKLLL